MLWGSIEALLISVADLSKLLFPKRRRHPEWLPERGEELRASLDVMDESPLARKEVRGFRNDLEHFDERLDEWAAKDERRRFVDDNLGEIDYEGLDLMSLHRQYDPEAEVYSFRGQTYDLRSIRTEVERVRSTAAAKVATPWFQQG